eukprot:scaffold33773_cov146-Isochrysis_galbana.AAC.1
MSYTYGRSGVQYSKTVAVQYVPYACISADAGPSRPASGRESPIPTPRLQRCVIHSVFSYVRDAVSSRVRQYTVTVMTW